MLRCWLQDRECCNRKGASSSGSSLTGASSGSSLSQTHSVHAWFHIHDPVIVATPRMRVFAGPNRSAKSVLKAVVPPPLLGV